MDYISLIEKFVLESWADGQTTPEIKQALVAKKWPVDLVEAVIDRLVKQKVEKKEGALKIVNGPDWWSQPTWPIVDSWAKRAKKKLKKGERKKSTVIKAPKLLEPELILPALEIKEQLIQEDLSQELVESVKVNKSNFMPKEVLLKKIRNNKRSSKLQLEKKIQIKAKEAEQMLIIQRKALSLCLVLFLILIFALYWQNFVIK